MYFRQPAYFSDFRCTGSDCQFTCCQDWRIDLTTEEVEKMKNAPNCSDELRSLFDKTFVKSNVEGVDYNVKFGEDHKCPLLTENGLCRVQKELGAEYLSYICMSYPRVYFRAFDTNTDTYPYVYRYCNLSCLEVVKRLTTDRKAMTLINIPVNTDINISVRSKIEHHDDEHPEYLFRTNMFEFFYDLISDKRYSVETAIINGAIAASILTDIVEEKQYDTIPQALDEMRSGFMKGNLFRELDEIKPDYNVKIGFLGGLIKKHIRKSTLNTLLNENGKMSVAAYERGEKKLKEMFDGDDFWLRNFALNLLFEFSVPLYSEKHTILENYSLFMIAFACIKFNAITTMAPDTEILELKMSEGYTAQFEGVDKLCGFTSLVSRDICQNSKAAIAFIEAVKDAKLTTPGQLALLIK